jgi:hypothetical protein
MKNLYLLPLLFTIIFIAGCECSDGEQFNGADLAVTNLDEVVRLTTGDVWAVTCIIKNIAQTIEDCNSPMIAEPANSTVEFLWKPETDGSGFFRVIDVQDFNTDALTPDGASQDEDLMRMPTPVRGTYQMKVKLNTDRAVSEDNFDNNTATISKVKL